MPYQLFDLRAQIAALQQHVHGLEVKLLWPGVPSGKGYSEAPVCCDFTMPSGQRFEAEHHIANLTESLADSLWRSFDYLQGDPQFKTLIDNIRNCPVT